MGFDVTFHPVAEAALHTWYFDFLRGRATVQERCEAWQIPDLFQEKLEGWVAADRALPRGSDFETTVGFHLAAACGIFARYHYLRGSRLSGVDGIERYTRSWAEIAPGINAHAPGTGKLTYNYSSGVFVSAEGARALRHDMEHDPGVRAQIAREFPDAHLGVLEAALDEAIAMGAGLLEASDVIEPDPLDLNLTTGASNRLNCDLTGPMLYVETARRQLAEEPGFAEALAEGRVDRVTVRHEVLTETNAGGANHAPPNDPVRTETDRTPVAVIAILCLIAAFFAVRLFTSADTTLTSDPNELSTLIDSLSPSDPWPLWSEDELPDNCFDGDPTDTQFLMCTEPDGSLAWTRADLGPWCRQYPSDNDVVAMCRVNE